MSLFFFGMGGAESSALLIAVFSFLTSVVTVIITKYGNVKIAKIQADSQDLRKEIEELKQKLKVSESKREKIKTENIQMRERMSILEDKILQMKTELERKEKVIRNLKEKG